ncbi:MAG TPA: HEAT repeat domain-containing protein, partial [Kofleriaceae bacterium]|nr:HEAT repeat domain-containing protein [Kofleriaceae bacterium]
LIDTQPANMDKVTWKDKRRDAARKLAQSKDKRAVPVLIRLAETETFDIIGEIAIEGLGNLGDSAAHPALEKIAADPSRDKVQRDLARKALAKLGAAPAGSGSSSGATSGTSGTGATPGTSGTTATGATGTTGTTAEDGTKPPTGAGHDGGVSGDRGLGSSVLDGGTSSNPLPTLPEVTDDTLAAYERVTFAGGTANLGYDSTRKRVDFDADVAGTYQKRIEREKAVWGWDAGAHVVAGYINPEGRALSRGLQLDAHGDGEARYYQGPLYGIGRAAVASQLNYVSDIDPNNANNTLKDTRFTADLQVAVGGGYGRVLDVGAAIRVRRLVRALDAARAIGKPIDAATTRRLQLTWWALRGERSTYRALVATVAILREASVLVGEPDAGLSYEILNVLRDSQLYLRPSGLDANLLFSEGYLQRPSQPASNEGGRVEQVLASAAYGAQLDDDKLELSGGAYARLRLFAHDNQPAPWAVGANARVRRFTYGEHGDPLGAIDLSGDVQISNDDVMNSQIGQRITGQVGFTWWLNAVSGVRIAANVGEDRGALFLGAQLEATYGLLDGSFAR